MRVKRSRSSLDDKWQGREYVSDALPGPLTHREPQQQARFPDAAVANQQQLKQVITVDEGGRRGGGNTQREVCWNLGSPATLDSKCV